MTDLTRATLPFAWAISALLTVGGGFYWLATLNTRVDNLIATVHTLKGETEQIDINSNRLTRIETELITIKELLSKHTDSERTLPQ